MQRSLAISLTSCGVLFEVGMPGRSKYLFMMSSTSFGRPLPPVSFGKPLFRVRHALRRRRDRDGGGLPPRSDRGAGQSSLAVGGRVLHRGERGGGSGKEHPPAPRGEEEPPEGGKDKSHRSEHLDTKAYRDDESSFVISTSTSAQCRCLQMAAAKPFARTLRFALVRTSC